MIIFFSIVRRIANYLHTGLHTGFAQEIDGFMDMAAIKFARIKLPCCREDIIMVLDS